MPGRGVVAARDHLLLQQPPEPAGDHLGDRAGVVADAVVAAADREPAVLRLARQPVLEDHQAGHDVGALDVADVEALDAQRRLGQPERLLQLLERLAARREVTGPAGLVQDERLARRCGPRSPSGRACRRAAAPAGRPGDPRSARQPVGERLDVGRQRRAPAPPGARQSRRARRRTAGWRRCSTRSPVVTSSIFSTTQPRWPRTRPPRTWKTCTAASSSSSAKADHVGVGAVAEHDASASPAPGAARAGRRAAGPPARTPARRPPPSSRARSARVYAAVWPAMKSQKSSTMRRCSSASTRPTQGAEHLPM